MLIHNSLITLLDIIFYLILARVIISWLPIDRYNPIIQFIYSITEPILAPIRSIVNRSSIGGGMMFDFSPIIAWLLIEYLVKPLVHTFIRF
ncbi:MAG: YggT family protein [Clostridiales bacterium]|nr:YggT family protein [Clostridiales bacterium]MDK2932426.1 YggT family protein [Clostridiales bacterium]